MVAVSSAMLVAALSEAASDTVLLASGNDNTAINSSPARNRTRRVLAPARWISGDTTPRLCQIGIEYLAFIEIYRKYCYRGLGNLRRLLLEFKAAVIGPQTPRTQPRDQHLLACLLAAAAIVGPSLMTPLQGLFGSRAAQANVRRRQRWEPDLWRFSALDY